MYCAHGEALSRLRTVSVRWVAFCNAMMASSEFGKNGSEKHYENILSFWKAAVGAFWSLQIDGCSPYGCHWTLHSWHWAVSKRKTPGKNKYSQWGVTDTSGVWGIPSAEWSFVFKQTNERCFMNCKVRRLLNQNKSRSVISLEKLCHYVWELVCVAVWNVRCLWGLTCLYKLQHEALFLFAGFLVNCIVWVVNTEWEIMRNPVPCHLT